MLQSMTGFGSAGGQVEGVEFSVEIRSVNNRYYKGLIKLPEFLSKLEADVDKKVRQRITRGSVTVSVRCRLPESKAAWRVNTGALSSYVQQLRMVEMDQQAGLRIDLGSLLQLPGVTEPPDLEELAESLRPGLMDLLDEAIGALAEMRQSEGAGLAEELLSQCQSIEDNRARVAERSDDVVKLYQDRLTTRVQELAHRGNVNIDEEALAREIAIFAERSDIAEELQRLEAHVGQFRQTVAEVEPAGRKLDFIAQEMLREANTMGSKCNDAEISQMVVDMKTAIDRIKEQVQNVE